MKPVRIAVTLLFAFVASVAFAASSAQKSFEEANRRRKSLTFGARNKFKGARGRAGKDHPPLRVKAMSKMPSSEITPARDAIVGEVEVAAPPERVFRALTDPAQLIRWWGDDICKTSVWEWMHAWAANGGLRPAIPAERLW
jgi:hypothetical protein